MSRLAIALCAALLAPLAAAAVVAGASPTVSGPVTGGVRTGFPFNHTLFDLAPHGYVEEEYFVSGTARDHLDRGADAPFTTRVVVRRPLDPDRFNGSVWIEWLNVTSGIDIEAQYAYLIPELLRSGYVAAIASCQAVGVTYLRGWDPLRYAPLSHPGDEYSFDICAQVAKALRSPAGLDPLPGLAVERVILEGESQSAGRLATYVNQVDPLIERVVDGFLISVGGGNSFRGDLDVPVLQVQSEQEVSSAGGPPDSAFYRRWEIAGGSHQDRFSLDYVGASADHDHQLPPGTHFLNAPDPPHCLVNRSTKFLAVRAALHHMHVWLRDGVPPPTAPRIQFAGASIARDALGNALGGLRLPHVEVPVGTYTGDFASTCAPLAGFTEFFDAATLASLYADRPAYEAALRDATDAAVAAGYILPADAHTWYCAADYVYGDDLSFSPFRDCDVDGHADPVDNCPHRPNPGLEDDGGIATATADGIGNACQCGDVSANGIVNGQDANAIKRHGVGANPNPLFAAPEHCDVSGNGLCNGQDANAIRREALGIEPNPLFRPYACESAQGDL